MVGKVTTAILFDVLLMAFGLTEARESVDLSSGQFKTSFVLLGVPVYERLDPDRPAFPFLSDGPAEWRVVRAGSFLGSSRHSVHGGVFTSYSEMVKALSMAGASPDESRQAMGRLRDMIKEDGPQGIWFTDEGEGAVIFVRTGDDDRVVMYRTP